MSQNSFQKADQLSIFSANCLNRISPFAQCHSCQDVCPQQALVLTGDRWEASNCSLCGLCVTVCPTQVFQIDQLQLLQYKKDQPLQLCCSQNTAAPASALRLNCLQQLSPLALLHLLYQHPQITLYLTPTACQQCDQHWYAQGLLLQLEQYQLPEDKLSIQLQTEATAAPAQQLEDRRDFFLELFHRTEKGSKKAVAQAVDQIRATVSSNEEALEEPTVFPSRLPLYALYLKQQLPVPSQTTLPFRQLSCHRCTFCRACLFVCPTKALELQEQDQQKTLLYHPELCVNCNLCQQICMQHGLQWDDFMTPQQFIQSPQTLAESTEKRCSQCGHPYSAWPPTDNDVCSFCQTE